ncbi:hypothetical protein [Ulvibacter litoralis]|uniref:Outer membrane protein beta-barrel domain-containing protein n=1 Tax=Ulvibacter litoralis TaxID=227084 RepID=A0A1G7FLJ6_9FLAO|nr:hypothetical protein [Ulvibacter litoralis]GHC50655.1 hypothetical protein GCM10008083_12780 [Ulvibacter litoralis]SDE76772.1 hypothetical protein SAMN05421855_102632 [Ulvibacter litoralis]
MKKMKKQLPLLVLLFVTLITVAQTETNERKGFLFEIGIGGGIVSIEDSEGIQTFDDVEGAFTFPEAKIGYMLNNNLAITAALPGTIYEFQGNDRHFGGFIPSLQYWVKDRWWIHGGIGLAIDGPALYDINDANEDWNFGCAVMASTGYEIYKKNNFAMNLQSKVVLGRAFLENDVDRDAVSFSLGVGLSWL